VATDPAGSIVEGCVQDVANFGDPVGQRARAIRRALTIRELDGHDVPALAASLLARRGSGIGTVARAASNTSTSRMGC
jgi:hypothetical protein